MTPGIVRVGLEPGVFGRVDSQPGVVVGGGDHPAERSRVAGGERGFADALHQHRRFCVRQDGTQFRGSESVVQRRRDRPDLGCAVQHFQEGRGIHPDVGDPVARHHTVCQQRLRHLGRAGIELAVGGDAITLQQGRCVRCRGRPAAQDVGDVAHARAVRDSATNDAAVRRFPGRPGATRRRPDGLQRRCLTRIDTTANDVTMPGPRVQRPGRDRKVVIAQPLDGVIIGAWTTRIWAAPA